MTHTTSLAEKRAEITGSEQLGRREFRLQVKDLVDFGQLTSLYQSVYGGLPDGSGNDYYRWLYHDNPSGRALIAGAESGGELVGHYAVVPLPIRCEGHDLTAGLGVGSLTRPDFQGRGIFVRLVTMVNEVAERQGIDFTYVVPSAQADPWFRKILRFQEASPVSLWIRLLRLAPMTPCLPNWARFTGALLKGVDLSVAPALRTIVARANPYGLEVRKIDQFGLEFDALWETAKDDFRFAIRRTRQHLAWRFGKGSTREYLTWGAYSKERLVAYVVVRVRELSDYPGLTIGVIADLFGTADAMGVSGARLLLAQALRAFSRQNIGACMMQLISPTFEPALRANGFFRVGQRFAEARSVLYRSLRQDPIALPSALDMQFTGGDHDMG